MPVTIVDPPPPVPGAPGALVFALYRRPPPRDLSRTYARFLATFSRPPRGLLKGFGGRFRGLSGRGQKRQRAREVVKSHRIGTKIRQREAEDIRRRIFGSPGPGGTQKGPQRAKMGFLENVKNHSFLGSLKKGI